MGPSLGYITYRGGFLYISKLDSYNLKKNKKIFKFLLDKKISLNNKCYLDTKKSEYKDLLDNVNGHSLDDIQRNIVLSEEDSTLVLAGAGSGKSLTILGRILYLVKGGVNPSDILCISFTNMACDSLRKSLFRCGIGMDVYTFHKLGLNILRSSGFDTRLVNDDVLEFTVEKVLDKYDLLDILPDYDFVDIGDGDFTDLHVLLSKDTLEFSSLKRLFITFINLFKGSNYDVTAFDRFLEENKNEVNKFKKFRNEKLLSLAKEIYEEYSFSLNKNKSIDFHDMINNAICAVEKYGIKQYKYIIVDEYQDTSLVKCRLLQVIKKHTGAKLLAVGDDFQSIYQFTGSNLNVCLNFSDFYPHSKVFKLENTYRNSQELLDIMGKFILKNKKQIKKKLLSQKHNEIPIYVYYYDKNINEVLNEVLNSLDGDVLILGRNNKDIMNLRVKNGRCMTVHKSKGLEADNVVIVNLVDGVSGFPNKICDDDLLKFVKKEDDSFLYAEERRLFYVAMTRTKNCNYLLVNKNRPSSFVEELLLDNSNIKIMNDDLFCPKCGSRLVKRSGSYGEFYGCKNYPKCRFTKKIG